MWRTYAAGPECLTVSEYGGALTCAKGLKVAADVAFDDCPPLDYLLIPGGFSAFEEEKNERLLDFVRGRAKSCRAVLSVCTGSFILEAAGLLRGKRATTHWKAIATLRERAEVTVCEERFVRDGAIWTSAGVSAGMDLLLAFIAEEAGEDAAATVQWNAEYYPDEKIYGAAHRDPRSAGYFRDRAATP